MNKIKQLHERRERLIGSGKAVRADISALVDEGSFVELSAYSFSDSEFYTEKAQGEGVVTGFATIDGFSFYIVAQNPEVLSGGVSKANCRKISKCLDAGEKSAAPVIYLLSSKGVRIGEGVNVLEGMASVLKRAVALKGSVLQFAVICGEVYGQTAALAGICDFNFFIKDKSVLAENSPLVISAKSGVNLSKRELGGEDGLNKSNLVSFDVASIADVRKTVIKIADILARDISDGAGLNDVVPELNKSVSIENLLKLFDKDMYIETGALFCPDVKCVLGKIGGITVAAVMFDGDEGVKLNVQKVRKIRDFVEFACCRDIPLVNFVNCTGLGACIENHNSLILKEVCELINILDCCDKKIAVVTGKATGFGYTLFAAKSMGYDYNFAFASAKVALFDSVEGAEIEFAGVATDKKKLQKRYSEENSDPVNAAKDGYMDNIIEPALAKQYLVASLQMLVGE